MDFTQTFQALASPIRRDILVMLIDGTKSAGEIAQHFDMTAAAVSYHLSQLREAGLVFEIKHKNFKYYELNLLVVDEAIRWLSQFNESKSARVLSDAVAPLTTIGKSK